VDAKHARIRREQHTELKADRHDHGPILMEQSANLNAHRSEPEELNKQ
jgi:hypothetical protein